MASNDINKEFLYRMIIINADDWGRSRVDTEAIQVCYMQQRITSVSAMVFMEDSERAAKLAKEIGMDVGLHLNFSETFTGDVSPSLFRDYQNQTKGFLKASRYAMVLYNPFLKKQFFNLYHAQAEEFMRLYGYLPSHIDGHQHMHLCANVLLDGLIPNGMRVRRSFSFWPGEKSFYNRTYRNAVDRWLSRRYRTADYYFDLTHILENDLFKRIIELSKTNNIELNTHPSRAREYDYLLSEDYLETMRNLEIGSYSMI